MTSAEFRELALMTSEDFDGRLHTYAIGIKLALEPNLQTCKCMQSGMQDLHWAKLAKLAIPVSRLGLGVQTRNQSFWGLRRLEPLIYIRMCVAARATNSSRFVFLPFSPCPVRPRREGGKPQGKGGDEPVS